MDILKVLVTTGTSSEFTFVRLLKIIDELCEEKVIEENSIIVQAEEQGYRAKHFDMLYQIENKKFLQIMEEADLIISHAGTGTVTSALKMGKKIIVFPRMAEYGELIDNHQLDLCRIFEEKHYILVARNKDELRDNIKNIDRYRFEKFSTNSEKFVDFLETVLLD